jgi:hypothetical protein
VTDASDANAPGWYPDPSGVHHQRYWSGDAWSARVADAYGVTAAHHIEQAFAPPGGGPPRAVPAPAKSPTPSLSLVESPEEPLEVVVPPEPAVPQARSVPPDRPRPPGWYPDPSGIHCERSWDGGAWSEVAIDRNGALLTHVIVGTHAAPAIDASPRPPAPVVPSAEVLSGLDDGWHGDPAGRFRERYFVDGRPSAVVRTARCRTG